MWLFVRDRAESAFELAKSILSMGLPSARPSFDALQVHGMETGYAHRLLEALKVCAMAPQDRLDGA